jgi:hypothetical protein
MIRKFLLRYEVLIFFGLLTAVWAGMNAFGFSNTDSDVFWALFGLAAAVEAFIELWFEEKT